jgi:GxxExxY protein
MAMAHPFEEVSGRILAAAVEVHKALGPGFLESLYQKAMEVALQHRGIAFQRQKEVHVYFEGVDLGVQRLDLVVEEQIVLELKAVKAFEDIHFAQVRSYLKATGLHIGLLLNFNAPTLVTKRVVL